MWNKYGLKKAFPILWLKLLDINSIAFQKSGHLVHTNHNYEQMKQVGAPFQSLGLFMYKHKPKFLRAGHLDRKNAIKMFSLCTGREVSKKMKWEDETSLNSFPGHDVVLQMRAFENFFSAWVWLCFVWRLLSDIFLW